MKIPKAHKLPTEEGYYFYYDEPIEVYKKKWSDGTTSLMAKYFNEEESYSVSNTVPQAWSVRIEIETE